MYKGGDRIHGRIYIPPISFSDGEYIAGLAQSIIDANARVIKKRGFAPASVPNALYEQERLGRVESVLAPVFVSVFGIDPADRYVDLFDQVSVFAEHLAKDHIFTDGNKRTTVIVSLALLTWSGVELDLQDSEDPEDNEVYKWIEDIVTERRSRDELADMLRTHARWRSA